MPFVTILYKNNWKEENKDIYQWVLSRVCWKVVEQNTAKWCTVYRPKIHNLWVIIYRHASYHSVAEMAITWYDGFINWRAIIVDCSTSEYIKRCIVLFIYWVIIKHFTSTTSCKVFMESLNRPWRQKNAVNRFWRKLWDISKRLFLKQKYVELGMLLRWCKNRKQFVVILPYIYSDRNWSLNSR